jgi:hypothetical protein
MGAFDDHKPVTTENVADVLKFGRVIAYAETKVSRARRDRNALFRDTLELPLSPS